MINHRFQTITEISAAERQRSGKVPEILCTLGPASIDRRTIQRLEHDASLDR